MTKPAGRHLSALMAALLLGTPSAAWAQSPDMNFFVAVEGAAWGADQPALEVSDSQCTDLGYAQGYGHLTWRAYLNGSAADGEGDQVARQRIGAGPWYNYYGVAIAESLAQLHSDENNLWVESAVTVLGEYPPDGTLQIPPGSRLDGSLYTRGGPFFCFGVPG
ncbi:MAG: hypothetical protein OEO79_10600 [Gemmatimonadota bacterium]|nr:hypothetical protein [Gemmatimonadota bacterium]MDH3422369.1 hypothetical protein [Gemmatimonadota bacterium]